MSHRVRIVLDAAYEGGQDRPYLFAPGERFTGRVRLTLDKAEEVDSVSLNFKGKYRVRIGVGQDERKWEYVMFNEHQCLLRGPARLPPGRHEYAFAAAFPRDFRVLRGEFHDAGAFRGLADPGLHELPPSVEAGGLTSGCEVFYRVTARVPRAFSDWEDKATLRLAPGRAAAGPGPGPDPDPPARAATCAGARLHYKLDDAGAAQPLSTRERLLGGLRHAGGGASSLAFTVVAEAPTVIALDTDFSIPVRLAPTAAAPAEKAPDFTLAAYEVVLKSRTHARLPGLLADHDTVITSPALRAAGACAPPWRLGAPQRLAVRFPAAPRVAPSFASFVVARAYDLELGITAACLDETFKFRIRWAGVTVLPQRLLGPPAAGMPPSYEASQSEKAALSSYVAAGGAPAKTAAASVGWLGRVGAPRQVS